MIAEIAVLAVSKFNQTAKKYTAAIEFVVVSSSKRMETQQDPVIVNGVVKNKMLGLRAELTA